MKFLARLLWCLCFSLTADAATTKPVKVPVPTFPTLRTRVLVDANLTPIDAPNPKWVPDLKRSDPDANGNSRMQRNTATHDYLVTLGAEECLVISNGTLNRHPWWSGCSDMADFRLHGYTIPDGNFSDPPTQAACNAVGKLLRNPARFASTARPHCPAFIDIEGNSVFTTAKDQPLANRKLYVKTWIDTLRWIQDGAGWDQELSIYGQVAYLYNAVHGDDDDAELVQLLHRLNDQLYTACTSNYWWDWDVENRGGGRFIGEHVFGERQIRRHCPELAASKTAFVNPYYQVYWPQNVVGDAAAQNGKPVLLADWCQQIDWLVSHDYSIVVWMGWSDLEPVRSHLAYVAQYGLTPKGDATRK